MLSRGLDQRIFSREEIAPQGAIKLESRRRWENPLQENRCETLLKKRSLMGMLPDVDGLASLKSPRGMRPQPSKS